MFDADGRIMGYGQQAPGRDLPVVNKRRKGLDGVPQPGQPDINAAIMSGVPMGGTQTPFMGARQTTMNNTGVAGSRGGGGMSFGNGPGGGGPVGPGMGVPGAPGAIAPRPGGGGMAIGAESIYDTSGMSDEQKARMASDTQARRARDQAGFDADSAYLAANGGQWGSRQQYRPEGADPNAGDYGGKLVGGSLFDKQQETQGSQGIQGGPGGLGGSANPSTPSVKQNFQTRLMEGDSAKLDPANNHQDKSPKYSFLQLANQNKYNYDQMPNMLKELQSGPQARFWQGWSADGKGNFVYQGDPSQLAPEWNGVKRVDAVGAFGDFKNGGQAGGWRWGADDGAPGGQGGHGGGANSLDNPIFQQAILGSSPTVNGNESGSHTQSLRDQILAALQVDPRLRQMGKTYGL
jgi:hypothetical protein